MRTIFIFLLANFFYANIAYSQQVPQSGAPDTKYHYCKITQYRGKPIYTFDFGENTYYNTDMGLDTLKKKSIVTILNRMGEFGWELVNVFVETDFFSTPTNNQNWILRKKITIVQ